MSEHSDVPNTPETEGDSELRPGQSPYRLGFGVGLTLTIAAVFLFLAFISVWANRQIFDSQQWTETSTEVIERPAVQNALANFLVDELFNNVNVESEIKDQLPEDWQVLASPATSALRSVTLSGTKKILELPVAQEAWAGANEIAHESLISTLEGGDGNVSTEAGTVTINARAILEQAADKLGLSGNLVTKIPADAGTFVIWRSDDLKTAQSAYTVFKDLVWVFAILTILLYIAAIALAKHRRRRAVIWMGASFVVVGLLVAISVSLGRTPVVDALAQTSSVVPAATDVYNIGTELLSSMAASLIFTGVMVLLATMLAGPYGWAIKSRRFLAPYLRDYLPLSIAAAILLYLIALWLIPVNGFQTATGIAINSALAIAGFVALVSITRREFPDAEPTDFGVVSDWTSARLAAARTFARDLTDRDAKAPSVRPGDETTTVVKTESVGDDATTVQSASASGGLDELERLTKLHASGSLTDEEFAAAKKQLLG